MIPRTQIVYVVVFCFVSVKITSQPSQTRVFRKGSVDDNRITATIHVYEQNPVQKPRQLALLT